MNRKSPADVCLILEGTYPYVSGGVANWANDLLHAQRDLSFHLVCLMPRNADLTQRYTVPDNVTGVTHVEVGGLPRGAARIRSSRQLLANLEAPLRTLQFKGGLKELSEVMELLRPLRTQLGQTVLLDSPDAWELLLRMYRSAYAECAFLDYFWTWRAILGGLYSVLLAPLPEARIYHALCTGYAGLFAARARIETGRPALLTEHGIYTNERRIEIAMADWLYEAPLNSLRLEKQARDLKDLWTDAFTSYSRACYEAASRIVTLFGGNQQLQIADGADPARLEIIPNAVDYERLSKAAAKRTEHPPTVALIGRVVPIKDVKTYIRAVAILRDIVPDLRALVLGPVNEDPDYFAECRALVDHLGLHGCFTFAGRVSVADYLGEIDVVVLTSISEAQPLVVLEAGAAGIPSVVTDVGACREMIYGDEREKESLGAAGEVVPLSNPTATAHAIARLLTDPLRWASAARAIRERVRLYYNKPALDDAYRSLYRHWRAEEPESLRWKGAA
jgi:glycosyltransferase involved in cell wall biosynthesis